MVKGVVLSLKFHMTAVEVIGNGHYSIQISIFWTIKDTYMYTLAQLWRGKVRLIGTKWASDWECVQNGN